MSKLNVFITGAGSGTGRATAKRFAREGYNVLANDINKENLESLITELGPGDHHSFAGSFADANTISRGRELIEEKIGTINALVNCAGLFEKTDPLNMALGEWKKIFDIMVDGCILTSQLALQFMPDGGRMVHITSIHGSRAEKHASSYSMAKSAINQFCRSMALELAERNILVNAIAPGFVDTAMSVVEGQNELESDWFVKNYIESHHLPLKRPAKADEIAGVAWFLAGPDASYITGQVIIVDGGLTITF